MIFWTAEPVTIPDALSNRGLLGPGLPSPVNFQVLPDDLKASFRPWLQCALQNKTKFLGRVSPLGGSLLPRASPQNSTMITSAQT